MEHSPARVPGGEAEHQVWGRCCGRATAAGRRATAARTPTRRTAHSRGPAATTPAHPAPTQPVRTRRPVRPTSKPLRVRPIMPRRDYSDFAAAPLPMTWQNYKGFGATIEIIYKVVYIYFKGFGATMHIRF